MSWWMCDTGDDMTSNAPKHAHEPFVLDDPDGWARFPCANCTKPLKVGDTVVMAPVCGGWLSHPRHDDRRKCR